MSDCCPLGYLFDKLSMDFIRDDTALSKHFTQYPFPIPAHDLKIKFRDSEFLFVKSLQCQLLQSL